jgi:hypothetical protein
LQYNSNESVGILFVVVSTRTKTFGENVQSSLVANDTMGGELRLAS